MTVTSTFAIILVLLAVGRLLAWRRLVAENAADSLNLVVLNVCLPAAILLYAPKLVFERELVGLVAIPWLNLLASAALVSLLAKILHFDRASAANLLLQVPLGNTSFIGYPLTQVLVGSSALGYAVIYDQFGSFIILVTWGLFVIAFYGGGERPRLKTIVRRVAGFPPFIALVLALTVMPAAPAPAVDQGLNLIAGALLPLVVLALGMQLRLRLPRRHLLPLVIGLFAKLVLMPLLAWAACQAFGLSGDIELVAVYLSAMPPMMTSGALLSMAGLAPELSAALIGYGIVVSMITLPLWHFVMTA
ncbi:MAG TPA: AEC family transporter [Dokdonella sp.]|uniref:AEC family transporter n=1 Tax=Dokdonella sp. TaxID=2291710 RepID=UPI002D80855D|nr:AEC family transporter [Dokdonella sp.]HET9033373.1 AEC family transporter [Dokdonella sp.]